MSLAWIVLAVAASLPDCEALDVRGDAGARSCFLAVARGTGDSSVQAEALWRAGDVGGANAAFRDAAAADPADPRVRARWGRLFLDVHQEADAETLFGEALALDEGNVEAMLGMAELSLGRFEPGVREYVARVLRRDPQNPEAHLLLARMRLELGRTYRVRDEIGARLKAGGFTGRQELEALAVLAAADALDDTEPSPWVARALAINPHFGGVHALPAHYYVINRRYREAVARYADAVAVQPDDWDAHAQLGINLLRVNRHDDARRHLEAAYQGDPYNALTVNTLRLLDLLDTFAVHRDGTLVMRAPGGQADVLFPYVDALVQRAREEMAARYGYRPAGPVVVEIYGHHDDFAVRTAGLPGLGILGATFGDVVVMDGPAAKTIDEGFDWASALWHELAHVYTLGATDNRVSRWFSEGVSVMEEWRNGPTPMEAVPLPFLEAAAEERLLAVADLDQGFLRPRYPQQVGVSYVQAGLVCLLIDQRFERGLADILAAYRQGADTEEAIRRALDMEPEALDRLFRDDLEARFGPLLSALPDFRAALRATHQAAGEENWAAAVDAGERAVALYPGYVQPDSPYVPLARAAEADGRGALLDRVLARYFEHGGRDPWMLSTLADRLAGGGDAGTPGGVELAVRHALVRTVPLNPGWHARLGDRLRAADRPADALAEYRAELALGPHDVARVKLRLAQTYLALEDLEAARRSVLEALEIAPRYGEALDLLVKLNDEEPR